MSDLRAASVAETVRLTTSGERAPSVVVDAALDRIGAADPALRAFSVVLADRARADAAELDGAAERGPLHGVPVAIKEEVDVEGTVTTFGGQGNSTAFAAQLVI